jgi:hypothetical protein
MARVKRTERYGLTLTPSEREALRYLAELEGLAEASVLCRLLRTAVNELPAERRRAMHWPEAPIPAAAAQTGARL